MTASKHASTAGDELVALTVRLPRKLKRDFAVMCSELGVTQQYLLGVCMTSALNDYNRIKSMEGER